MTPSFTPKRRGGDCLLPSFWWKGLKEAPGELSVFLGVRRHIGVRQRHRLEKSKGKICALASEGAESEDPGTLLPIVGSNNAWALLQTRCGPGGEKAGLKLLYILFKKTAWKCNGIPVVCSEWNVDKPETKAEQQQCSSRRSMETSEEDMKVLERVTVIFKYVLGRHSEDMKPLHNGTVKKELLSSLFYLSFPQPMLESKPMLAKVGNGRQGVSQTVRKGPCP